MAHAIATLAMLPLVAIFWAIAVVSSKDNALSACSQIVSILPGIVGCYLRSAFYCQVLEEFHPSARIEFGTLMSKCGTRIENNVYVGPYCLLGLVTLKQDVLLGPAVQIPSGPNIHGIESLDIPIRNQPGDITRVTVERDCWIGGRAIVLADVAEQTVVGAGSIVTRPLPSQVVAVGNPARVVRSRDSATTTRTDRSCCDSRVGTD